MKLKSIIKKTLLLFFVIFINQCIYSKENYIAGYVIKLNGDTLHGFINYKNWAKNPNKISFKSTLLNEETIYTPMIIKEFGVKDQIYISGIVDFETSSVEYDNISFDPNFTIEKDTIFLQTLIKGDKNLYLYSSKSYGHDQYYFKKDTFELLKYRRFKYLWNYHYNVVDYNIYIQQLRTYMEDCPDIEAKLTNIKYRTDNLIQLYKSYYDCIQSKPIFQKKPDKPTFGFGLFAGVSQTSIEFLSAYPAWEYLVKGKFNQSTNLTTGLFFEVISSKGLQQWSMYNELMYSSYNITGTADDYFSNDIRHHIYNINLAYSYLKMNNLVRFSFPVSKVDLFINGGISNGLVFSETNYQKTESILYGSSTFDEEKAIVDSKKYEFGYLLGFGIKLKKRYSLEYRVELGNGMSPYVNLGSSIFRNFLIASYRF